MFVKCGVFLLQILTDRSVHVDEDVRRIQEAMQGWGTDDKPLIEILASKNNSQRQVLKRKYNKTYKKVRSCALVSSVCCYCLEFHEGDLQHPV